MQATSLTCVDLGGHRGLWAPVPGPVAANPQRLTEREYPNMTKKFTWTRGLVAVMLLAGFTSAHALKFVQATGDDPGADPVPAGVSETITYAKETLLKGTTNTQAATDKADKTMYYNVARDHFANARSGVDQGTGDSFVASYTLEGMVFRGAAPAVDGFELAAGGGPGDKEAIFRRTAAAVETTTLIALTARFAVSEEGGSITLMVRNPDLEAILGGGRGSKEHGPVKIMFKPALKVTAVPAEPAPQAKATSEFMNFGGPTADPTVKASLGTFQVGVVEPHLEDAQGADNSAPDIDAFEDITATTADADPLNNPVTFSVEGGFGFVKTLSLANHDGDEDATQCETLTEIRKAVAPATSPPTYMDETTPKEAQTFEPDDAANPARVLQHLCIEVDGKTAIPETGPFMVMSKYKGLDSAAFPPAAMTHELAMIRRDGTTVHIPFLSIAEKFNHRILLRNHSSQEVAYSITFDPEAGTTATAGPMASGTVGAKKLKILSAADVVELEGRSRTAATLMAPIAKEMLDVSTSLVNRNTGDVDTETHMPE